MDDDTLAIISNQSIPMLFADLRQDSLARAYELIWSQVFLLDDELKAIDDLERLDIVDSKREQAH